MKLKHLVVAIGLTTSFSAVSNPSSTYSHHIGLSENQAQASKSALTQTLSPWASADTMAARPGLIGPNGPAAAADCSSFIGLSGSALVTKLATSDPQCVSPLYSLKGTDATALFSEANMLSVADGITSRAPEYTGLDSTGIESLIYFQRAALYVQFYSPEDVPAYSSTVKADIKKEITAIFDNAKIWTISEENSGVLKESLILIDSAGLGADFNHITKRVLSEYNADWQASWGMNGAANAIFTTLFRAQWDDAMKVLFATDHSILDSLNNFQLNNRHLVGSNAEYVLLNAIREMSRLYHIPQMKSRVTTLVKAVLDSSSKNDESKVIWLAAAEMADYYDRANCNYYDICGFKAQLEADTLSFNWQCSDTLMMRAQALYQDQAKWACEVLGGQEIYFHSKLGTNNTPVANDNNEALELVVFDSSSDYQSYAGTFFGINTNNGGMYLEGSPAGMKNQARFIAYEAQWRQPDFHIWNLQHEYVHYLDGRYNLHGDFGRGISANTIWWIEGLAEYISYRDANTAAIAMGETAEYPLSTIFKNNYDSGQDRIYRWGYLAVRFMFENHKADVDQILAYLRNDQYEEYQVFMDSIGTRYDNEWTGWLTSGLSAVDNGIIDHGPSDADALPSGIDGNWAGPKPTISTDYSPCTVTDEAYRYSDEASLKLDTPMECIDSQNGRASFAIANVDSTAQEIWIKVGGGWGDADIYYSTTGWASGESNEGYGIGNGNHEVIKVTMNPDEYWHYITLAGDFGGVDMLVSITEVVADPDPAQGGDNGGGAPTPVEDCGSATISYGQLTLGQSECISGGKNSLYVYVEEDNTQLTISTAGGSGDANLYFNAETWASSTSHQASSTNTGNDETLYVTANRGWRYITVDSESEFSGVTVTVELSSGTPPTPPNSGTITDACLIQAPTNSARLTSGEAVCADDGINYYSLWIDEGTSELTVTSAYGSGDISLYGGSSWSNANSHEVTSTTANSTSETFTVSNPISGWYYITLESEVTSSGVAVQAELK
ncbi:M9 family metallopeptidase [Shewanella nanhaiensis]|uniref:microbial collagenase n=1 Tax=Shewanella nanhaiensis TaxID=2864872 RepID=A0ABS7E0M5_9GAMM|nr:M9 family metallopeptidase [Shewanella nanhaiensis]MBW8183232.1 M9 family metallopeptidase [Shewanella nanhaiensis]